MNSFFKLQSGKHIGKTIGWLEDNEPSYLAWIIENRSEMLKGSEKEINESKPKKEYPILPYLRKIAEKDKKDLK